jgi:hypothetical protein
MTKAVWGARIRLAAALGCAVAVSSCGNLTRQGQAPSYLVMTSLEGPAGAPVQSDVLHVDEQTGATSIAADPGQAVFQLALKDPGPSTSPNTPSPNNSITLTQYHVQYVRSDGHNSQGVDVPFAFDGGLNVTVAGNATVAFTLVRVQAKQEAPLRALAFGGGENSITTVAQVTFFGHDQTGNEVSVSGNLEVTFSDFAG